MTNNEDSNDLAEGDINTKEIIILQCRLYNICVPIVPIVYSSADKPANCKKYLKFATMLIISFFMHIEH